MSIKVFSPPAGFEVPKFTDYKENYKEALNKLQKDEEKYLEDLKDWCKKNGSGKFSGKEVHFPVADGSAVYVVLSMKPCKLIHVPLGDAYSFPYIDRLTSTDIRNRIL